MRDELTVEEIKLLYDFLGSMNYYERMAVLCKISPNQSDTAAEALNDKLIRIIAKLS